MSGSFLTELNLPKNIKIYLFFSNIHLEAAENNFYDPSNPPPTPINMNKK
jgi:hypothetical protein